MKMKHISSAVGLALAGALMLSGCTATGEDDALVGGDGDVTTQWRDKTPQDPINPDGSTFVDHNDTSRQDGEREIKFVSREVPKLNPVTKEIVDGDETTIFSVKVAEPELAGATNLEKVYRLKLDDNKKPIPEIFEAEDVDLYTIAVDVEYVSGFEEIVNEATVPLFWPITAAGATVYVSTVTKANNLSPDSTSLVITAGVKTGTAPPIGVRYLQFDKRAEKLLAPPADVFPEGKKPATAKPEAG